MSVMPRESNRDVMYFLDPTSWETCIISSTKYAFAVTESDQATRPLRHAMKIVLNGVSHTTHAVLNTPSRIILPGTPTITRLFTWAQMPYAIRAVSADEVVWQPNDWMQADAFPANVTALQQMKPFWQNIDYALLRTCYPAGGELLQNFARCFDNALQVAVKPIEEIRNRYLWPSFLIPPPQLALQYDAPTFPDEDQTRTFLACLPQITTLDTARITAGLHAALTQWLHDGKSNSLRVYHADRQAVAFMRTLVPKFENDTQPATYTIRFSNAEHNWKYRVNPQQRLAQVAHNERTGEILRMGVRGDYYQIDRMPLVMFVR